MTQQIVPPRQFDILQRELVRMEAHGHGAETCVVAACRAAGIAPPQPFETLDIVVKPDGKRVGF